MFPGARRELTGRLFDRLVVSAVVAGFVVLFTVGVVTLWAIRQNQLFSENVAHTLQVETAISDIRVQVERREAARRGLLLTGSFRFTDVLRQTEAELQPAVDRLASLTADNPAQVNRLSTLRNLLAQQEAATSRERLLVSAGRRVEALETFDSEASQLVRAMRDETAAMAAEENRLLEDRRAVQSASAFTLYGVLALGAVLVLAVGSGSIFVILRYTHDLSASRDRLRRLNAGLEAAVAERTTDLTRANEEIQRFAYIVSHDLRSPLVNVMGFTSELTGAMKPLRDLLDRAQREAPGAVSAEAREAIEVDLPESIGFIRTSTQKMDRLINAILRLSREGRRVLIPEPVDMPALFEGVRASLRHRLDELGAQLVIEAPMPGLVSDRLALEQIFGNLLENALKYLQPGRPGHIVVRGREEGDRLVFEVQDNGRGIDPKDHERVFELFRRAGSQDQPGEGIGLAHVRALAYRLGGLVTCESELDRGATFRISLPRNINSERAGARD